MFAQKYAYCSVPLWRTVFESLVSVGIAIPFEHGREMKQNVLHSKMKSFALVLCTCNTFRSSIHSQQKFVRRQAQSPIRYIRDRRYLVRAYLEILSSSLFQIKFSFTFDANRPRSPNNNKFKLFLCSRSRTHSVWPRLVASRIKLAFIVCACKLRSPI